MYSVTFFSQTTTKLERRNFHCPHAAQQFYAALLQRANFEGRKYCYLREGDRLIAAGQFKCAVAEIIEDNFSTQKKLGDRAVSHIPSPRKGAERPPFFEPDFIASPRRPRDTPLRKSPR